MRVAVVTGIFPPTIGGPATHAATLKEELSARGHKVTIVTLIDETAARWDEGFVGYPRSWAWPRRSAAIIGWLVRNRARYDVTYAVGMHPVAVAGSRLARRPVVSRVVADFAWERGTRKGMTREDFDQFQSRAQGGRVRAMQIVRNWSLRRSRVVTVPTDRLAEHVVTWRGGDEDDVVVVPNAASAPAPQPVPRSDRARLRAVSVGRLIPLKRVDVVIDAVGTLLDVNLEIIGDGPERSALERRVRRAGLEDRIMFAGPLPHNETMDRIAAADVLVIPSSYDTSPNVVVEALVSGTPVVGSAAGGLPDLIRPGESGLLIAPLTSATLAETLNKLDSDRTFLERLAEGASREGKEFRIEPVVDRIEAALSRAVGKPRGVFIGRAAIELPLRESVAKRLEILNQHLDVVVLAVGDSRSKRASGARLILWPRFRPRVISTILFYVLASPLALFMARKRRSAIVCQGPHTAFGPLLLSRLIPRSRRPRTIVEVHGDWRGSSRLYGGTMRRLLAPGADRAAEWSLRRADRVRTVGEALTTQVRRAGYLGEVDSFVAYSDLEPFTGPARTPIPDMSVLFAGALEPIKGVDVLLSSWPLVVKEHPGAKLTIAGDGPMRRELERSARPAISSESVRFVGHVGTLDLAHLLDDSTCLVLPSRSEGTPRIILEAMARGRAVVATTVGGVGDLVEDGSSGLLVPPDDPEALAAALVTLLSDVELAVRMGQRGFERFDERDPSRDFYKGIGRMALWIGLDD